MSTKDQLLAVVLHGTAFRYAIERRNNADSIAELREIANGRDDLIAETAGLIAGSWCASPATHAGHELLAAGMLILAARREGKPLDYSELERWTRIGFERGTAFQRGERASPAGEHKVVSRSALNPLLEQCGHRRGDRDSPSGSRCLGMPEVVIPHRVFRPQLPG
jgi:hypothetical protein